MNEMPMNLSTQHVNAMAIISVDFKQSTKYLISPESLWNGISKIGGFWGALGLIWLLWHYVHQKCYKK